VLKWTRPAAADRREIREYIARDNPAAALDLDEMFERKAAALLVSSCINGRTNKTDAFAFTARRKPQP